MNDLKPIERDTAFMFLPVTGISGDRLVQLVDYWIAVHRHETGPATRIEIASGKLTMKQRTSILDHASKLGLSVDFTDIATGQARRLAFPRPPALAVIKYKPSN